MIDNKECDTYRIIESRQPAAILAWAGRPPVRTQLKARPRLLVLSAAIAACFHAGAVDFTTPVTAAAGEVVNLVPGDTVTVTGDVALRASGRGADIIADGITLTLLGNLGTGVIATQGGKVALTSSTLDLNQATGSVLAALDASGMNSAISASDVNITAKRNAAGLATVNASAGSFIDLDGGSLTSEGSTLLATGSGSTIRAYGTAISTGLNGTIAAEQGGLISIDATNLVFKDGNSFAGADAYGKNSKIFLAQVEMTNGMLHARDGGSLDLDDTSVTSKGGVLRLLGDKNSGLTSSADIVRGVLESDGGHVLDIGESAQLVLFGTTLISQNGSSALYLSADTASADVFDADIRTDGTVGAGNGIYVVGGRANLSRGTIKTQKGGYGLYLETRYSDASSGRISTDGLNIAVNGNGATGAFVSGEKSHLNFANGSINALGDYGAGIAQIDGGQLSVIDASIRSDGLGSVGFRTENTTDTPLANVATFTRSALDTTDGTAIRVDGGNHEIQLIDSTVISRLDRDESRGELISIHDVTVDPLGGTSRFFPADQVRLTANNSQLTGDVSVSSVTAQLAIELTNGSTLTGAMSSLTPGRVSSLSLDTTSRWNVRGESALRTLDHAGTIAFVAPTQDDFKTLTINGDYVGNNGTWIMHRKLGDDSSLGDQVVIRGNSSGTAGISVLNAGGAGAATSEGIRLVSVTGQSNAQFTLLGRSVAGAYEYQLFKGGVTTPDDGNWYLRSEVTSPVTPPVTPPVTLPVTPVTPSRIERPEPAAYLANQSAALRMFQHSLHDRVADTSTLSQEPDAVGATAWAYLRSSQRDSRSASDQVSVDSHVDSLLLGVGRAFESTYGGSLQIGVMGGQGRARNNTTSRVTGYSARGDVTGTSLGVYGTWLQNADTESGFYVDSWLQYGRFRNSVQGDGLQKERYRSHSWTGSAEIGYAISLQQNELRAIYLEPQLQVLHSRYDADRVTEANGTVVQSERADGTTTRVGARLYTRSLTLRQGQVHPFLAVNWWSGGNASAIAMNGERLQRDLPRDIYEAKAGVQVNLSGGWRGWGGSTPFSRTLTRRPIQAMRSVHVKA